MQNEKVLLLELKERVSAAGNAYMSGWLGKASVVAFAKDENGERVWQVYVQTPAPKSSEASSQPRRNGRVHRASSKPVPRGQLDDDISDLGFAGGAHGKADH